MTDAAMVAAKESVSAGRMCLSVKVDIATDRLCVCVVLR